MKRTEEEAVKRAIRMLMEDDPDFSGAVGLLCQMVGWTLPQDALTRDVVLLDMRDLHRLPEGPFRAP